MSTNRKSASESRGPSPQVSKHVTLAYGRLEVRIIKRRKNECFSKVNPTVIDA